MIESLKNSIPLIITSIIGAVLLYFLVCTQRRVDVLKMDKIKLKTEQRKIEAELKETRRNFKDAQEKLKRAREIANELEIEFKKLPTDEEVDKSNPIIVLDDDSDWGEILRANEMADDSTILKF